jgi:hypothetical protein
LSGLISLQHNHDSVLSFHSSSLRQMTNFVVGFTVQKCAARLSQEHMEGCELEWCCQTIWQCIRQTK